MSSRDPTPLAGPLVPLSLAADPGGLTKGIKASIGMKYVMGWTGLLWCSFLVMHLAGNFALFAGADAFNAYAAKLESLGPLLIVAELGLAALFLLHVVMAITVTLTNWGARPDGYDRNQGKGGKTIASSTMIWTGLYVLVFFVTHLATIKFAAHEDLFQTTVDIIKSPFYVAFYVLGVCLLGFHVSHGVQSAFRTIGIHGPRITPKVEWISVGFGFVVALGYSSIPLWAIFTDGGAS